MLINIFKKKEITQKQFILNWLNKYDYWYKDNKSYYIINDDYSVDCNYSINITDRNLTNIEIKFNNVNQFYCSNNKLTSLYNSPSICNYFICYNNKLTSLEYTPKEINKWFSFEKNNLITLEGLNINFNYIFHNDTKKWLKEDKQQKLIDDLLIEQPMYYNQFKDYLGDNLKNKYYYLEEMSLFDLF